tara:strand:+ start:591 stop:1019 length:429 start_codon:yes stop_codon:yes gene_type:complete
MSEIKVDTLTGKTTANDITVTAGATATMSLEQGLAKAWANINGSVTNNSVYDSLNVSSVADVSNGVKTITFTSAFNAGNNYTSTSNSGRGTGGIGGAGIIELPYADAPTTTVIKFFAYTYSGSSGGGTEPPYISYIAHGDLA